MEDKTEHKKPFWTESVSTSLATTETGCDIQDLKALDNKRAANKLSE